MTTRRLFRITLSSLVLGMALGARAQSFNVDLEGGGPPELGGGAPDSGYGAATGQTGFWNMEPATGTFPHQIRDLEGILSGVTLYSPDGGPSLSYFQPENTGNYAKLMNDLRDVEGEWKLTGLQPGAYAVTIYSIYPVNSFSWATNVEVTTALGSSSKTIAGPYPYNQFQDGKTHATLIATVTNGELILRTLHTSLSTGYCNGFQISQVPEPATLLVFVGGLGLASKKRRQGFGRSAS